MELTVNSVVGAAKWKGSLVAVKLSYEQFEITECHPQLDRHANIVRFYGIYFPPAAVLPSFAMECLTAVSMMC